MKYLLYIPGISCNHCKIRISKKLEEIGVKNYQVDVISKKIMLETNEVEKILQELSKIGYTVEHVGELKD